MLTQNDEKRLCSVLSKTLDIIDDNPMVVGHTAQHNVFIRTRCDGDIITYKAYVTRRRVL